MTTTTHTTEGTPVITRTATEWSEMRTQATTRNPEEVARQLADRAAAWSQKRKAYEAAQTKTAQTPTRRTKADRRNDRATNRTRRNTIKARTRQTHAAAKIRRNGTGTLATHCIAAGLPIREARSVAGSLRKNAAKAGVTGTAGVSYTKGRARQCVRYTSREVARIAAIYRPRKPAYKAAAARLALAA